MRIILFALTMKKLLLKKNNSKINSDSNTLCKINNENTICFNNKDNIMPITSCHLFKKSTEGENITKNEENENKLEKRRVTKRNSYIRYLENYYTKRRRRYEENLEDNRFKKRCQYHQQNLETNRVKDRHKYKKNCVKQCVQKCKRYAINIECERHREQVLDSNHKWSYNKQYYKKKMKEFTKN